MGMAEVSISAMLSDLMADIDCGALRFGVDFIKDLNKFYKKKGFLTENQQASLRKVYKSHMG